MNFRIAGAAKLVVACSLAGGMLQPVSAQDNPDPEQLQATEESTGMPKQEPVAYRHHVKQAMQGHLAAFGLILIFRAPHEDHFAMHADALAAMSAVHASLYPAGSESAGTSPRVWEQAEAFEAAASKTSEAAEGLKKSIETRNRHAILNQFVRLSESCEACHARFRANE